MFVIYHCAYAVNWCDNALPSHRNCSETLFWLLGSITLLLLCIDLIAFFVVASACAPTVNFRYNESITMWYVSPLYQGSAVLVFNGTYDYFFKM